MSLPRSLPLRPWLPLLSLGALVGCQPAATPPAATPVVWVSPATAVSQGAGRVFTAILQPRVEAPVGFRVGGRVAARLVETGQSVRAGQPIELLARRPDVIAARAQWHAEQARRQAAQLDLFPRFFVSLVTGRQDLRIQGLDLPPVGLHQTALAFALPLFNAGRIQAGIERQDAVLERAELRYAQAVRQALEDVDSALVDLQQNTERAHDLARVEASRARAAARGARLYAEGQVALPDRLALSQAQVGATLARIDATEAAWLSHIQLHRALGGGWQHSPAPTATTPSPES